MRQLLGCAAFVLGLASLQAQNPGPPLPSPRLNSLFPSGAQAGTTVEVLVSGLDIDEPKELLFTHPGLTGEYLPPPEPKPDPKAKVPPAPKKLPPPTSAKFKLTVAKDVPLGAYDIRIRGRFGVSNPRLFTIGSLPETTEAADNDDAVRPEDSKSGQRAQRIALGTTVNGFFSGGTDVDYSVFAGKAGQRVIASCRATSIDSRARPLVEIYDTVGKRIALNRGYADGDALADATLPADGDYYLRLSEFAYQQGGPDYFYRLTVGVGPWVDAVFPPLVNPGKTTPITVFGRNLPGGKLAPGQAIDGKPLEQLSATVTPPKDANARFRLPVSGSIAPPTALADGFEFRLPGTEGFPVAFTDLPIQLEKATDNDKPETAEELVLPGVLVGRIDRKFDRDTFRFIAKKGESWTIDLAAARLGSDADVSLRVRNEKGNDLAGELDDDPETLHPVTFYSRNTDPPAVRFTAPEDGVYRILVASIDANVNFGPRCFYALRVSKPAPDFRVFALPRSREYPGAVNAQQGGETAYDLFVHRIDGFLGAVTVTAAGLPPGVSAAPAQIGSTSRWGTLVLSATADAKGFCGAIKLSATSGAITREVRPASIVWAAPGQNNTVPTVTRLDQQLVLAVVADKAVFRATVEPAGIVVAGKDKDGKPKETKPAVGEIFVREGDKVTVPVKFAWSHAEPRTGPINLYMETTQPNATGLAFSFLNNNNNQPVVIPKEKNDGNAVVDIRPNAFPGVYSLTFRAETQVPTARDPNQKDKKTPLTATAFTIPLSVVVVPSTLGKVSTRVAGPVKRGGTTTFIVQLERKFDLTGETKVTLTIPMESGLTARDAVIPAGKDEATITVTAAADAKISNTTISFSVAGKFLDKFPVSAEGKVILATVK